MNNMTNLILIKYGEISLKKGNRKYFEKKLVNNIKLKFKKLSGIRAVYTSNILPVSMTG